MLNHKNVVLSCSCFLSLSSLASSSLVSTPLSFLRPHTTTLPRLYLFTHYKLYPNEWIDTHQGNDSPLSTSYCTTTANKLHLQTSKSLPTTTSLSILSQAKQTINQTNMSISLAQDAADLLQKSASLDEGLQEFFPTESLFDRASSLIQSYIGPEEDQEQKSHHVWSKESLTSVGNHVIEATSTAFYVATLASYVVFAFALILLASTVGQILPSSCHIVEVIFDAIAPPSDRFSSCKRCQCSNNVEEKKASHSIDSKVVKEHGQ